MSVFNIISKDSVEEYKINDDKEFSFSDLISYDAINIFEYKIYNTDTTEEDFDNILKEIFSEDKVEFLDLLLNKNLIHLDMLSSFFENKYDILGDDCLCYLIQNNLFPYYFNEDYFLLEALFNENVNSLKILIEFYNQDFRRLSKHCIEALSDFHGNISIFSFLIHNFMFSEKEFSSLLKPCFSFFKHNSNQKYFYYEIIQAVINQQLYHLIDKRVLENCLDNDNYQAATLLLDLNIPISCNSNGFLHSSIYNNDRDTFYKITNHTNFDDNFINKYHFEDIFVNDAFGFNDYKYLIDKYLINICIDYEEDIEDYDIGFYENLHDITLTAIEYDQFDFFVYLYNLKASYLFYRHEPKYKEELLKKALQSYSISTFLFIENKEPIYLEKNKEHIIECFEKNTPKIANLILNINEVEITNKSILNAIYCSYNDQGSTQLLESFLSHEKINTFDNLNFALLEASNICPKSFSLLWDSSMTHINNENYKEILINLIKLNNLDGFIKVVNSDFMNSVSLNDFAYEAVKHSKSSIFEFIIKDKRFTSLNDTFSPYNAILNKTTSSFSWNKYNNDKILKLILENENLKINSTVISLLNYAISNNNFDLFKDFLQKNKDHIKLWKEELNDCFLHSIKFFDNNEFAEFLFYNSFIDLSLIGDKVIACIDIKRHDKTFIIDLLKNINNADSFNLFVIFQKTYKIDFDIASVLFRKSNLKEFLIEKQKPMFDNFNKKFIAKNMTTF